MCWTAGTPSSPCGTTSSPSAAATSAASAITAISTRSSRSGRCRRRRGAAGVLRDIVVKLGTSHKAAARPDHAVRVILVKAEPHQKTGGRKGGTAGSPSDGILRIATDLLDVPAEIIADIYKYRWSIELFFRFFKHVLGCRHLLSTHPVAIQVQAYCAIIACLLIHLWTGGKPTLRTFEMLCLYLQGWATLEELMAHVAKLKTKSRDPPARS